MYNVTDTKKIRMCFNIELQLKQWLQKKFPKGEGSKFINFLLRKASTDDLGEYAFIYKQASHTKNFAEFKMKQIAQKRSVIQVDDIVIPNPEIEQ